MHSEPVLIRNSGFFIWQEFIFIPVKIIRGIIQTQLFIQEIFRPRIGKTKPWSFCKEDFRNAELDTFFVTAPYTKSFQSSINYNIAQRAYLKFYWRQFERKDRLELDKFHYKTKSLNTQFSHRFRKIDYNLRGEYGKTTNLLLSENNQQTTYRGVWIWVIGLI